MLFYRDENKNNFLPVGSGNVRSLHFFFLSFFLCPRRGSPLLRKLHYRKAQKPTTDNSRQSRGHFTSCATVPGLGYSTRLGSLAWPHMTADMIAIGSISIH